MNPKITKSLDKLNDTIKHFEAKLCDRGLLLSHSILFRVPNYPENPEFKLTFRQNSKGAGSPWRLSIKLDEGPVLLTDANAAVRLAAAMHLPLLLKELQDRVEALPSDVDNVCENIREALGDA